MLDYNNPAYMLQEAQAAEAHALKTLAMFPEIVQTLVGSYYRSDMVPAKPSPENYPYSYVSNVKPQIVFNNPRFNASAESASIDSKKLLFQAKFVNRWAVRENFQKILDPYVATALLIRSVILTTFENDPDDAGLGPDQMKRKMPRCHLIENHRYFRDPVSTPATPPRYKGHIWVRDLEDVKKMKGVKRDVLDKLIPDVELKRLKRPNDLGGRTDMPERFEILAYEMWVPECNDYRTNRGHNGTIFTIAIGQSVGGDGTKKQHGSDFLLPPRPYYGPKWGPYTELEFIEVPGQTYGTSPVSVVMQQVEEVNAHVVATAEAAGRMKHLVIIDAANDTLQTAVQDSPDGSVIGIPNVTKEQINSVLIGGPAPEQYQYNEAGRQRLDRNIGMDASQRGGESPDQTATASNIQYRTLNVRMKDLKRITAAAVMQIANTVSWYGWESNNVVMSLGGADADEMGMKSPTYLGGPQQGEQLPPWEAEALQLEPYSMEAVDEDKLAAEVNEALAIIAQIAQEMQTAPWLGYDVILEHLGKLRKFDWMHEAINGELFAEWMKEQVQQGMEKHQAEQAMVAAQIEGMHIDNAMKKMEMMLKMKEADKPAEQKGPSVSIGYKDLPEDMKRVAETEAFGTSSAQPLTSPAHIANQMDVHKTNATMTHDTSKLAATQQHDLAKQKSSQVHERKQSQLAGMLKNMANGKRNASGMKGASNRARNGPLKTASRGQKAFAGSR